MFSSPCKKIYLALTLQINFNMAVATFDSPYQEILQEHAILLERKMPKQEFVNFALRHKHVKMERESDGTVIIYPMVKRGTSKREGNAYFHLALWQRQTGLGEVHGGNAGFDLEDESTRSPDAAWISDERLALLPEEESEVGFMDVAPDFVIEVCSSSDSLEKLKTKMENTWMENGVRLAWLIDPYEEKAYVYREN